MISNRVKRNIWLTLSVLSVVTLIGRAIQIAAGEHDGWTLIAPAVILGFSVKFYLSCRRKVREGILFGNSDPWRR